MFKKITLALLFSVSIFAQKQARIVEDFNKNWNFKLGDYPEASTELEGEIKEAKLEMKRRGIQ